MSLSITFLSLNLCGQDPSDGSNPWTRRKELCVDLLKKFRPIIFCIQAGEHRRERTHVVSAVIDHAKWQQPGDLVVLGLHRVHTKDLLRSFLQ